MTTETRPERTTAHEYQVEFAAALSAEKELVVYPIDASNAMTTPGVPWSADIGDRAYAIKLTRRGHVLTLAFDFDAKLEQFPGHAAADAAFVQKVLGYVGIHSVMTASGPDGGRHVLVTLAEPGVHWRQAARLADKLRRHCKTLDVAPLSGPGGAIRPPLAPHRREGRSELIGLNADVALAMLLDRQDPARVRLFIAALPAPPPRVPLPRTPTSATGDGDGGNLIGPGGSEAVFSIAMKVANVGGDLSTFSHAVHEAAAGSPVIETSLRKRSNPKALEAWLALTWKNANRVVAANPAVRQGDDASVIEEWAAAVLTITHKTGRRAAEVLLELAQGKGRALVGITVRDLAAAMTMSRSSAGRGLDWLVEHSVIERASGGDGQRAARYRLLPPSSWRCDADGTVGSFSRSGGRGWPTVPESSQAISADAVGLDIWSSEGFGEATRQTYAALLRQCDRDGRVTVARLSECRGVTRRSVQRSLKTLSEAGLARNLGGGHWTYEYRDPRELAEAIGAAGTRMRILARHHAERLAHIEFHFRDMLGYLLTQDNWQHVSNNLRSARPENHSQIEGVAVPVAPMKIILPRPVGSDTTMTGAPAASATSLVGLPTFTPSGRGAVN